MSIFGSIMSAIFGRASAAPAGQTSSSSPNLAPGSPGTATASQVDVEATLNGLAKQKNEKLDWRHSIVDLMKLLDLDSSFAARKQLAQELHFSGDTNDSASMNIWLHKQVMTKLAENGGKVPADLRH